MTELLTIEQVAAEVQVHPRTVRRAINRGDLRAADITGSGTWRIRRADFDAWLEQRANASRREPVPSDVQSITAATRRARPRRARAAGVIAVTPDMGRTA